MKIASGRGAGASARVHAPVRESLSWRPIMQRAARSRTRSRRTFQLQVADRLSVSADLINLVWRHKLWWMVPLLLAMVVLAALVVLEATPIGPLLYPIF